ncbi:MAG: nitronate monooxygenase [Rhodobacterales bacterium]
MLETRLTKFFDIDVPIVQAPMAFAAGGALASAVTNAGGLGFIGGGYGDATWLDREFTLAGHAPVGCGFITWSLANQPELLTRALEKKSKAIFLSFGNPAPFAPRIKAAGVPLICQVQTLKDAKHAIATGADIIVAQGAEAGGHGEKRATFSLVPEVADYIANAAPEVLLVAAGGIADGRGLAASLMLGADGVLVGSRFWAAKEALVHPAALQAAIAASGDDTIRTSVIDIVRGRAWEERYNCRVLDNQFTMQWHGNETGLKENSAAHGEWQQAATEGNPAIANGIVGEAVGLIHDVLPARDIIAQMVTQAKDSLKRYCVSAAHKPSGF